MPRNLEPLFAQETAKAAQSQLYHLVQIQYPAFDNEPAGWLHLVDANVEVSTGGQVYQKFPLKFNGASMNSDGSIDQASLTVANVSLQMMRYVRKCDGLRNMRVKIRAMYENALDWIRHAEPDGKSTVEQNPRANPNAYVEEEYLIDNYQANETTVVFSLLPIVDLEIKLPRRRYMTDSCYWTYKDPKTCGYSGDLPTCNKTLADCRRHTLTLLGSDQGTMIALVEDGNATVWIKGIPGLLPTYRNVGGYLTIGDLTYGVTNSFALTVDGVDYLVVGLGYPYRGLTGETPYFRLVTGGNEQRFGGFPGVSGSRRIML